MRERVASDGGWPMPYLHDESQEVARAYGAQTTPDVFVLDGDGRVAYRGAPDADYEDPSLNAAWLRDALDAVLASSVPDPSETKPVGCSIKWKGA
jgi:peroxiredoxin